MELFAIELHTCPRWIDGIGPQHFTSEVKIDWQVV